MSTESTVARPVTATVQNGPDQRFVQRLLPWIIAGGSLLLYLVTLNHWVSLHSLEPVSMVAGWNPQPELARPLYWLITAPLRLLPQAWLPLALNLFSAVCAALVLYLLARSVALLPHDRTEQQRLRERNPFALLTIRTAWVPPLLAVILCGLQLSFWENATAASSDMFDLLVFAYLVRCLLEFRLFGAESWLLRAAFIYGASMTANWAMIAFFPLFIAALVWIKGVEFFNIRFLRRMFLLGTVGLCFYLLLPMVTSNLGFWLALKANLGTQKNWLGTVFSKFMLFQSPTPLWVLSLFSLIPVLVLAIRSPAYFGDPSKIGVFLATFIFQVLYAAFFCLCLWVLLDPPFSPRNYVGATALPLYFLAALAVGYFCGYFLLVFGGAQPVFRGRPTRGYPGFVNFSVTALLCVVCGLGAVMLLYRNLPQIRITNGLMLREYSELMARNIPTESSIVLSDDSGRAYLMRAISAANHGHGPVVVDTSHLASPAYHQFLRKVYPTRWTSPVSPKQNTWVDNKVLQDLIVGLGTTNTLYYLHPSFGYYFEAFYLEPHGLNYKLVAYPANTVGKPPLSDSTLAENETLWTHTVGPMMTALTNAIAVPERRLNEDLLKRISRRLYLTDRPHMEASMVASYYSRALDCWGVELQRNGKLEAARVSFERARDLNPDNFSAEINLQCNAKLSQPEHKLRVERTAGIEAQLGKYSTVPNLLNFNGPVDEPTLSFDLAKELFKGQNYRQAAQEFQRVSILVGKDSPDYFEALMSYASACLYRSFLDETLKTVQELKQLNPSQTNAPALLRLEAFAYLFKSDRQAAQKAVEETIAKYPDDERLLSMASSFYLNVGAGFESNALKSIDQELKIRPENTSALVNKGLVWLRLGQFTNAIPPLTEVVQKGMNASGDTNIYYAALYNRGLALWKSGSLEQATKDFEEVHLAHPDRSEVSYVLGEIAWAKNDTGAALLNYKRYMASAPPANAPETSNALVKLKELEGTARR